MRSQSILGATRTEPAEAFDRRPVVLSGLTPDSWGQSITNPQSSLRSRYDGITLVFCTGVIMAGYRKDSSWLHGTTRYWDKLACAGTSTSGSEFALVYDHKNRSAEGWKIYRLRGISIGGLARLTEAGSLPKSSATRRKAVEKRPSTSCGSRS